MYNGLAQSTLRVMVWTEIGAAIAAGARGEVPITADLL